MMGEGIGDSGRPPGAKWIWVDLESTAQVLFLEPLIRRMQTLGWRVSVSAKPQEQTLELARLRGLPPEPVGLGDFSGLAQKLLGNGRRVLALRRWLRGRERPSLLVSCSRSASAAAWLSGVPGIALLDYEHASQLGLGLANRVLWMPDLLRGVPLSGGVRRIARFYPGLKENLYLDSWQGDRAAERNAMGVSDESFLVVARPPATTAHYAANGGDAVWLTAVQAVLEWPRSIVLVVPRDSRQREALSPRLPQTPCCRIANSVRPGPGLVLAADLVISGGGTMNREAAVLGVPAWSTFTGKSPRIDECLAAEGRLRWVRSPSAARLVAADGPPPAGSQRGPYPEGLRRIVESMEALLSTP